MLDSHITSPQTQRSPKMVDAAEQPKYAYLIRYRGGKSDGEVSYHNSLIALKRPIVRIGQIETLEEHIEDQDAELMDIVILHITPVPHWMPEMRALIGN